ncbi:MAG: non-heme iron oxygenase ferredoxin subunit [Steroidobacteraceae bacterium]|jgi:nitrite reductase/ring-hydroxylating ferredoxin subunit|nr:non-heme iron oxygenase ferredoxin subunit [Steroidobacteraceae bacterium]
MGDPQRFHVVAELAALREGRTLACRVEGRPVVVCRTRDGLHALDDLCTHALARMSEGRLRGTRLTCPLHAAAFDVCGGQVLSGPATRPLATHAVRVAGGRIEVAIDPSLPPLEE